MKCRYCGKSAGLFSRVHSECEEKHKKGMALLQASLSGFFLGSDPVGDVIRIIGKVKGDNYLSQEDVEECCRQGFRHFADMMPMPITKDHLQKIDTFIRNVDVSAAALNKNDDLKRLAMRLYEGVMMSYFVDGEPMWKVEKRLQLVASLLPLSPSAREEAGLEVLDKAAGKFLANGLISSQEQAQLDEFSTTLQLPVSNLPQKYGASSIAKVQQAAILRQLSQGIMPTFRPLGLPIMLTRGEGVIWTYDNVTMLQEKITREWRGGHNGLTIRVMKGVYYRTGGIKGRPVETSTMETVGTGMLLLTNKNIWFHCDTRSVKIPYTKIAGMTPYSDGIEIHQEGAKAQRQLFQGLDSWFILNLLSYIKV